MSKIAEGEQFNDWILVKDIGAGANGDVWLAHHHSLKNNRVAIKFAISRNKITVERFKREAKISSELSWHPNIIKIITEGEENNLNYIVMEFADGGNLANRIPTSIAPKVITDYISQIAYALDEAHKLGYFHRDVKPSNILFVKGTKGDAIPKLADFGIAYSNKDLTLSKSSERLGTVGYSAPEQFSYKSEGSIQADTYSLAVVAYEMLTLRKPFEGNSDLEIQNAQLNVSVPPLNTFGTPTDLQEVFNKALNPNPNERYNSAGEFAASFSKALGFQPTYFAPTQKTNATQNPNTPPFKGIPNYKKSSQSNNSSPSTGVPRTNSWPKTEVISPSSSQTVSVLSKIKRSGIPIVATILLIAVIGLVVYNLLSNNGNPAKVAANNPPIATATAVNSSTTKTTNSTFVNGTNTTTNSGVVPVSVKSPTVPPTPTSLPTSTPVPPTKTPLPTNTPVPPTNTPVPTATPIPPTNTPAPPTATPTPAIPPAGTILFQDDFQNGVNKRWTQLFNQWFASNGSFSTINGDVGTTVVGDSDWKNYKIDFSISGGGSGILEVGFYIQGEVPGYWDDEIRDYNNAGAFSFDADSYVALIFEGCGFISQINKNSSTDRFDFSDNVLENIPNVQEELCPSSKHSKFSIAVKNDTVTLTADGIATPILSFNLQNGVDSGKVGVAVKQGGAISNFKITSLGP